MKTISHATVLAALLLSACALTPTAVPGPNPRRTPVPTWTLPFGPSVTPAPFETQPAADTPLPVEAGTPTPTARPGIDPTLDTSAPDPFSQLVTPVPEPMPQLFLDDDIVNILLLGRDTAKGSGSYRTDVMIVVSINKTANSVTLLTIPRDLFVYIPGWTMNRINTASAHGDAIGYPGGGVALLEQTILYNLGLPIHGWARIDFDGFKQVIDILGGVDLPVSCAMQDWRLKDPYDVSVDVQDADNWHLYTVEPGVQHMDGDLALWYARSRKRSSDFDRSRRQHQVLRAMLDKGLQLNVLPRAPELYQQYVQIVDTDLGIGDVLQFVPMAAGIDRTRIKSRFIGRAEVWSWTTPQGAAVLLPDRAAIARLLEEAFQPPAENVLARAGRSVEIWNGTLNGDWAALATDNLAWAGIASTVGQADRTDYATTLLFDYTSSPKGSIRAELQMIFHIRDENVVVLSDPNAGSAYRVVLGSDYDSCVRPPQAIHPTPTPAPGEPPPVAEAEIVHAARIVGTPPTVGGDISEWTALVYPVNQPSFGRQNWTGPDDLSVSWNTAWDDKYLYLAGKVKDDVLVQNATGENLFRGDSLEIWLSVDPGSRTETLSEREFQFGVSFGDLNSSAPAPTAYLWMPAQYKGPVQDALIAAGRVEDGYTFEIAIPWSVFRLTPFSWQGLGLTLAFNDNDSSGTTAQESQIVNRKDAKLGDARTWGVLILDPEAGQ